MFCKTNDQEALYLIIAYLERIKWRKTHLQWRSQTKLPKLLRTKDTELKSKLRCPKPRFSKLLGCTAIDHIIDFLQIHAINPVILFHKIRHRVNSNGYY